MRMLVDDLIPLLDESDSDHLIQLRQYRNSIASISLLPNDILLEIFFEYVHATNPWSGRWTTILFVCRRWNALCMTDARLWSFISLESSGTLKLLQRSKNHLLHVRVPFPRQLLIDLEDQVELAEYVHRLQSLGVELCPAMLDAIKAYMALDPKSFTETDGDHYNQVLFTGNGHRIESLDIEAHSNVLTALFRGIESLPSLKYLKLKCRTQYPLKSWKIPTFLVTTKLYELHIENCVLVHMADYLTSQCNLTHLALRSTGRRYATTLPSFTTLVQVLQQLPRLQFLSIWEYVRVSADELASIDYLPLQQIRISLPELGVLDLDFCLAILVPLFRLIEYPTLTSISFVARGFSSAPPSLFPRLLAMIRDRLDRCGAPWLRSIRISSTMQFGTSVSAHYASDCPSIYSLNRPYLSIRAYLASQSSIRRRLTKILKILPIHHSDIFLYANDVLAGGPDYLTIPSWMRIFNCLPVPLTIIAGNNEGTSEMLEGMMRAMSTPTKNRKHQRTINLQLSKLVISASSHAHHLSDNASEAHIRNYSKLIELLTMYQELHVPWKCRGKRLPWLDVVDIRNRHREVYFFTDQLWEVCDRLFICGEEFHPVKLRNLYKRFIKELKERRVVERDFDTTPEDEDLSDEEPIPPKNSSEVRLELPDRMELFPDELKHIHEEEFGDIIF